MSLIISHFVTVDLLQTIDIITDDPEDNMVLECVVEGKADYIISGDRHLLSLKEYKRIRIMTTKEFIERVNSK